MFKDFGLLKKYGLRNDDQISVLGNVTEEVENDYFDGEYDEFFDDEFDEDLK